MAVRSERRSPKALVWLAAAGLLAPAAAGCGKSSEAPSRSRAAEQTREAGQQAKPVAPPAAAPAGPHGPTEHERLHQSFLQATRRLPPPDQRPPDRTMIGKSVGK